MSCYQNDWEETIFIINDLHLKAGVDQLRSHPDAIEKDRYFYASPNNLRNFVRQANIKKPDMILLLGDICDQPSDWELFQRIWAKLDPSIQTYITIGNHDLDDHSYDQLVRILTMGKNKEQGGSRFNHVIEFNNTLLIILDTTFDADGQHGSHYKDVHLHDQSIEWLKRILKDTAQQNIILASHVGPHLLDINYFNNAQAQKLRDIVEKLTKANQSVKWVFGHYHVNHLQKYNNLGNKLQGVLLPAMIMGEEGRYTEIIINRTGLNFRQHELAY